MHSLDLTDDSRLTQILCPVVEAKLCTKVKGRSSDSSEPLGGVGDWKPVVQMHAGLSLLFEHVL